MKNACLALAAAIAVTSCSGCCVCRRLFKPRPAVIQPAPLCAPSPSCCPSAPCGSCDSCGCDSGMSVSNYGDAGLSYPMESAPMMYGNPSLPPGP
ncbi:hypothetical protein Pla123a_09690 [Posidoniimonas polymericola]|uniref:Uncharacterized protein n=1 Tax=Posidoniimonas polymericola TaxID=2528002 RepID=A0A5C5YT72_9BACT|nr:hypothetical protein [Posidoniimonas polymericola]TWT78179.1 hypothetical protein Pla123a_09690 [Posidoniimonas polymericola]